MNKNANAYLKLTFIFLCESFLILFLILWVFLLFVSVDFLISGLLFNVVFNNKLIPKDKQKKAKGYTAKMSLYSEFTLPIRQNHQTKSIKRNAYAVIIIDLEEFMIREFILWFVSDLIDNVSFISFKKTGSHVCNKLVIMNMINIGEKIA